MWENAIQSVKKVKSGDKGLGCILAHNMGLGKTFQVCVGLQLGYTFSSRVIHSLYAATIVPMAINYVLELDHAFQSTSTFVLVFSYL